MNVAVSRASYEMKVFSSLKAEEIYLYRTNVKGVKYLKSFLEYAERGSVALMHMEHGAKPKRIDDFIELVASALRAKGYAVNTNIGSSEYRVDIEKSRYLPSLSALRRIQLPCINEHRQDMAQPRHIGFKALGPPQGA